MDYRMNDKNCYILDGYKRGKSTNDLLSCRQILNVLVFLGFMVNYMLRVNLTIAIVDMVVKNDNQSTAAETIVDNSTSPSKRTARSTRTDDVAVLNNDEGMSATPISSTSSTFHGDDKTDADNASEPASNQTWFTNKSYHVKRFNWSESQQGYLLGSFFWGYIMSEIPGGRLAETMGARKVFGSATLGASVLTLLTPMCAKVNFALLLVCRIVLGLFMGPTWPSVLPLAANWIPADERGKFLSNMMASTLGAAFTLPICGLIIANLSWEYVFYFTGVLGFFWSISWFFLVYDSPAEHPRISDEERYYIESKLGINDMFMVAAENESVTHLDRDNNQVTTSMLRNHENQKDDCCVSDSVANNTHKDGANNLKEPESYVLRPLTSRSSSKLTRSSSKGTTEKKRIQKEDCKAPWTSIVTSTPVWAFVITHACSVFGYFTVTNQLPTYMKYILDFDIKKNGFLSSLPYIAKYTSAVAGGVFADSLIRSSNLSRNVVRKLFTAVGVGLPGCIIIVQIFVGQDKVWSIVIFTLIMLTNGFVTGGYLGNSLEIAPKYSGTVFGIANMFSGFCGTFSALMVGYLTDHNQTYGQWQKAFAVTASLYFLGVFVFLFLGSTKAQPWNSPEECYKQTKFKGVYGR